MADFIAETTFQQGDPSDAPHLGNEETGRSRTPENEVPWALFVDGAANKEGCGASVCLVTPENDQVIEQAIMFDFPTSNNQTEYEVLIAGLNLVSALGVQLVTAHSDSQLIVNQVRGEYEAINPLLARYCSLVRQKAENFSHFELIQVGREDNNRTDYLSKITSSSPSELPKGVQVIF